MICLVMTAPVWANEITLYDNGPIQGTDDALTFGYAVADTFTLTSAATINDIQFGVWLVPGDVGQSVQWSIGTSPNDFSLGSAVAATTQTNLSTNLYGYQLAEENFGLGVTLAAGTYWLTLQNASVNTGDSMFWDVNQGPSEAWGSAWGNLYPQSNCAASGIVNPPNTPTTCSESFQVYGPSVSTPEPASVALLGSGLLVFAGLMWKLGR